MQQERSRDGKSDISFADGDDCVREAHTGLSVDGHCRALSQA